MIALSIISHLLSRRAPLPVCGPDPGPGPNSVPSPVGVESRLVVYWKARSLRNSGRRPGSNPGGQLEVPHYPVLSRPVPFIAPQDVEKRRGVPPGEQPEIRVELQIPFSIEWQLIINVYNHK